MSEEDLDEHKYVLFILAGEQYGARLLEIREVVESLPLKKVPNTIEAFQGVGNLREPNHRPNRSVNYFFIGRTAHRTASSSAI
jgi:hypothetical protein